MHLTTHVREKPKAANTFSVRPLLPTSPTLGFIFIGFPVTHLPVCLSVCLSASDTYQCDIIITLTQPGLCHAGRQHCSYPPPSGVVTQCTSSIKLLNQVSVFKASKKKINDLHLLFVFFLFVNILCILCSVVEFRYV